MKDGTCERAASRPSQFGQIYLWNFRKEESQEVARMIVNQNTAIIGADVVLVPYRAEHVPTYHKWMLSPELRELTASEPLTLDEEYDMQQSWQKDSDKLTFIILARPHLAPQPGRVYVRPDDSRIPTQEEIIEFPMVGDVNLFFKGTSSEIEEVEAEVMIAEDTFRHKGVASGALQLLFCYATSPDGPPSLRLPTEKFVVRVGENNHASQRLFEKLGFVITKQVHVFNEVEMRHRGDSNWKGGRVIVFE